MKAGKEGRTGKGSGGEVDDDPVLAGSQNGVYEQKNKEEHGKRKEVVGRT
jgi:hypothetical protein